MGTQKPDSLEPLDLIASLLPLSSNRDDSNVDEDVIREAFLLSLRLQWTQTSNDLESIEQELELLRNAPREDPRRASNPQNDSDATWRLDMPQRGLANLSGPILDPSGRVSSRRRLRSVVD